MKNKLKLALAAVLLHMIFWVVDVISPLLFLTSGFGVQTVYKILYTFAVFAPLPFFIALYKDKSAFAIVENGKNRSSPLEQSKKNTRSYSKQTINHHRNFCVILRCDYGWKIRSNGLWHCLCANCLRYFNLFSFNCRCGQNTSSRKRLQQILREHFYFGDSGSGSFISFKHELTIFQGHRVQIL